MRSEFLLGFFYVFSYWRNSPLNFPLFFFTCCFVHLSGKLWALLGKKSCSLIRKYLAVLSAAQERFVSQVLLQGRTCARVEPALQTASVGLFSPAPVSVHPSRGMNWAASSGFALELVLTFLTVTKSVPRQLTKLCLAFSCLKQTDREKPVGKCNCFLNRLQGTGCQVTVIESSILQLWEPYQRREGITDMGDCRTCFCRRLSRFYSGGLFVLLKQGGKKK